MISNNDKAGPQRELLERKIVDAAEGLLPPEEIRELEANLLRYPDLHSDYLTIMDMPDLSAAYGQSTEPFKNDLHVQRIRKLVREDPQHFFNEVTVSWFKKYALAASFLIFGLTSLVNYLPYFDANFNENGLTDYMYPYDESDTDAYVTYLNTFIEP